MAIHSVPYLDPTRLGQGEQPDGKAWIRECTQDFAGYTSGELSYVYKAETYAGDNSWRDGSQPVAVTSRALPPWLVRNALRSCPAEFAVVSEAFQRAVAAEMGGVYVADDPPAWIFDPMETGPPEPDEPEAGEGD